jgi:formate hydrogenlyase subunit 6/NADH:ubiquinone oxidoreductase subunit I
MAAQIDMDKCTMCGGYTSTLCVEVCPDQAIRVQDPNFCARTATNAELSARIKRLAYRLKRLHFKWVQVRSRRANGRHSSL